MRQIESLKVISGHNAGDGGGYFPFNYLFKKQPYYIPEDNNMKLILDSQFTSGNNNSQRKGDNIIIDRIKHPY